MGSKDEEGSVLQGNIIRKPYHHKNNYSKESIPGSELWTDGLICAFEYGQGRRKHKKTIKPKPYSKLQSANQIENVNSKNLVGHHGGSEAATPNLNSNYPLEPRSLNELGTHQAESFYDSMESQKSRPDHFHTMEEFEGHWIPIGWVRISELVKTVQIDSEWASQELDFVDDETDLTVADLAAPYWERPAGPTWWCHVTAGHNFIDTWLTNVPWLHPAISIALRDESRLISERMKHLLYEVPVRVAGGLLFELLGQSVGDPYADEDDIPVVLRSWQAQNYLVTVLHTKGSASTINVLGITEVQEQLLAGGNNTPRTVHEVIAQLANRLARWDDRLFRKSIFGTADEVELKFVNRRTHEDLNLFSVILNQEIRRLSRQVIRVKWSLHAREEIIFELLQHLKGYTTRSLLGEIRKSTREMLEEQEAVRGRLFTIQDVMQSTVRAWLQVCSKCTNYFNEDVRAMDRSLRVTHNLAVFGGCGLVLSIITGLFGINVDGIPGAESTPYAFGLFAAILFLLGIVLIAIGILYLGLKKPVTEEQVEVRKLELEELVKMFQHEAETHAQVRKRVARHNLPPTAADRLMEDANYVFIN